MTSGLYRPMDSRVCVVCGGGGGGGGGLPDGSLSDVPIQLCIRVTHLLPVRMVQPVHHRPW